MIDADWGPSPAEELLKFLADLKRRGICALCARIFGVESPLAKHGDF